MSSTFDPLPAVPPEIDNAAQSGELVVFVGAGISRLVGCPSWDQFAERVLMQLVPSCINHYELTQIKSIADARKRLSIAQIVAEQKKVEIDYPSIFKGTLEPGNIYEFLNLFNSAFVTTNYEKYLSPVSRKGRREEEWRFIRRDQLLPANLDENGNVIHLHGCVDDPATMVITTRDYLDHYSSKEVQDFLRDLFQRKIVLFLGYGLEELEVLEYIVRRGGASAGASGGRFRRYVLQGFFNAEMPLFELLRSYYRDSFGTELVGYPKDTRSHKQQIEILAKWSAQLTFGGLALSDEVSALEDEIRGS